MKPNIRRLNETEVEFEDGSRENFDAIIFATGYRTAFPFPDKAVFDPDKDVTNLYRRMISVGNWEPHNMTVGAQRKLADRREFVRSRAGV